MTKTQQIQFYKQQALIAKDMIAVSQTNIEIATRLESEAKRALEELGANQARPRKGTLSNQEELRLKARLIGK